MDETEVRTRKIEIDQEKTEYINFAYNEEITYWKKAVLDRVLKDIDEKELVDLDSEHRRNNFYLKSMYSTHNEELRLLLMIFLPTSLLLKQ